LIKADDKQKEHNFTFNIFVSLQVHSNFEEEDIKNSPGITLQDVYEYLKTIKGHL
jgi:predicted transcriptional regulator